MASTKWSNTGSDWSILVLGLIHITSTGCPDTMCPNPQHNWAVPDPKPIYFLDPTSIPGKISDHQLDLPTSGDTIYDAGSRPITEQNMLSFFGVL